MRALLVIVLSLLPGSTTSGQDGTYDVVIYGGTSGGVAAAIQAKRMGKSVVLVEPTDRVGGLTTGGLGQTDIGNKRAIGGVAREFYQRVKQHYDDPAAWKWQTRAAYQDGGQTRTESGEDAMWTFEPSAALKVYVDWLGELDIPVLYGQRLDRRAGVAMTRSIPWRIISIRMESGVSLRGRVFLDTTYEGDLMAAAQVAYTVGREANSLYDETLNGVQTRNAIYHQFVPGVDPYVVPGDPGSGLLPFLDPDGPGEEGAGDHRVQAYCFRMCLTDHPENRIPFHRPEQYDPQWYELLLRNYEAGETGMPWINSAMPNRKTDTNNRLGFSTDFIGQNYEYPEASYERRAEIVARHRLYQQGLMWTLANHPRIPEPVRSEVARWGMCRDEFADGQGWQDQLYVREARRMVSDYVMTQHHCQGRAVAEDPVGLGAYGMDSHHVQRYVDADGQARNEGDVQVGGFPPYPISYRAIVPRADQCANLLVPICLSASHIAFGSIRMEPVFMVLGQSAATAAVHAIDEQVAVQRIDYARMRARLLDDNQVLEWTARSAPPAGRDPATLPGVVIDETQATLTGFQAFGSAIGPFVGLGYRHDGDTEKGRQRASFPVRLEQAGTYEVRVGYSAHPNRATNVPVTIRHAEGETRVELNQRQSARIDRLFEPAGRFRFEAGADYAVDISNTGTDGHVIVDAVQLVPVDE
jgi:hypothetical protein